jgi:hypothetical protein
MQLVTVAEADSLSMAPPAEEAVLLLKVQLAI